MKCKFDTSKEIIQKRVFYQAKRPDDIAASIIDD